MDLQVSARNILVNVQDIIFVQEDNDTQVIHFKFNRNEYEAILPTLKAYVLYRPNGTKGVNFDKGEIRAEENIIDVAWAITRNVSFAEGKLEFQIVFTDTDDPVKNLSRKRWATKIVSVTIPKSLLGEPFVVPEEPIIAQLIGLQENVEAAIDLSKEATKTAEDAAKKATEAAGSIQLSVDAKDAALAAKEGAETAKIEAEKLVNTAENAKKAAETAKDLAETAAAKADADGKATAESARSAREKANEAAASAEAAASNKGIAEKSAEISRLKATEAANSAEAAKESQDAAASSEQIASQKAAKAIASAEATSADKNDAQKSVENASLKATEAANSAKAAKESQDVAERSAGIATTKATEAVASAGIAETAATTATTEAAKVKTWKPTITDGVLTFFVDNDPTPPEGYNVIGPEGPEPTIVIGANGNWFVNGADTGKPSRGEKGDTSTLTIGLNGNFFIDGEDTGQKAQGPTGTAGADGKAATIRIGTVATGEAGTQASVNNDGTESDAILNITIPRGSDGTPGKDGPTGATGEKGADGATWLTGTSTPTTQGKAGDFFLNTITYDIYSKYTGSWAKIGNIKGATGVQGQKGDTGATGPQGQKGDTGDKGLDGATWLSGLVAPTTQGKNGDFFLNTATFDVYSKVSGGWTKTGNIKGAMGPKGDTGAVGPQGPQGVQGPKGDTGARGLTGANGPKGDTGATGLTGPAGAAATITIGTVTTGAAGTNAAVSNAGTANAAKLNFTLPRGAIGPQGPQGPQGPKGDPGVGAAYNLELLGGGRAFTKPTGSDYSGWSWEPITTIVKQTSESSQFTFNGSTLVTPKGSFVVTLLAYTKSGSLKISFMDMKSREWIAYCEADLMGAMASFSFYNSTAGQAIYMGTMTKDENGGFAPTTTFLSVVRIGF